MNTIQALLSAPIEELLVSGSDTRAMIDSQTGLNSFGCTPAPRPEAFSFGSSTATSISHRAFRHVEEECGKFRALSSAIDILDEPTERLRNDLRQLLGLEAREAEIVFSPSGTDSALHALFLARTLSGTSPIDSIVLASDETGSGVPNALSGRHFSTLTAQGVSVTKGGPVAGLAESVALISLPMRNPCGVLRTAAAIDSEVLETVTRSVAAGHRVLLQAMDSSKLGVRCPSLDCLQEIQSRFADSVCIVIDACQMRISLVRLKWHLQQGHMVLISGSKFFTGPPFSGALLVPPSLSARLENIAFIPPGLKDYTGRSAWPRAWKQIRNALPTGENFGQYFRWTAALAEMRAYFSVPLDFRRAVLQQVADLTTAWIRTRHPELQLMEEWEHASDTIEDSEMAVRTIFPFLLRQGNTWLSFDASTNLYRALNRNIEERLPEGLAGQERALATKICHIGQPVSISLSDTEKVGALRICTSARTVSNIWFRERQHAATLDLAQESNEIVTILDKIALYSRYSL